MSSRKKDKDLFFMGSVRNTDLLSADQEKELAADIAQCRVSLWREIFSYPPWSASIVDLITQQGADKADVLPLHDLRGLQDASVAYRRRGLKTNQAAFDSACAECAKEMAKVDLDGDFSALILKEINAAVNRDRETLTLTVPLPPEGSMPFNHYVEAVLQANKRLSIKKERFVKSNIRLVVSIARRYSHVPMPMEDIIQEGMFGLMKSVCRFDGDRGYRFSTYAAWWIRHAINRSIDNVGRTVRVPTHVAADVAKLNRVQREHEAKTGETLSPKELAKKTGLKVARVQRLLEVSLISISLEAGEGDGEGGLLNKLEEQDAVDIESFLRNEQLQEQVVRALDCLSPVERDILMCRFGLDDNLDEPMTLRQVGDKHSLSRERIRQLQEKALVRLRQALRGSI